MASNDDHIDESPHSDDSNGPVSVGSRSAASWIGVALLVIAFPVAAWFLIGDVSSTPPSEADYLVRPLPIPGWVENAAGIAAIIAVLVSVALLYRENKRGSMPRRAWVVSSLLIPAGLITSVAGRIITAGGIGANIGGGMMLMVALPFAALLAAAAIVFLVVSISRERPA